MTTRVIMERDLRAPEFAEGSPEDYEFRSDGKIVRKDRWERGIKSIVAALGWQRRGYEIPDVVEEVRRLADVMEVAKDINFTALVDELILSWNVTSENTQEAVTRRLNARQTLDEAIARIVPKGDE